MSIGMKKRIFESIVVPKVMYGSESWFLNAKERSDLEVFEMKGLRNMCGITIRDRIRNERIRERCGWERGLVCRYEQSVLKWYGHVIRRGDDSLGGRVIMGSVEGNRGRGRPKRRWMNGVREALERRGVIGDGRELVGERIEWRGWYMEGRVGRILIRDLRVRHHPACRWGRR